MSSLRDAIAEAATRPPARPASWTDRLSDDVRTELLDIRREWQEGKLQASGRGLAAAILQNCQERGIPICGFAGVREWLMRRD